MSKKRNDWGLTNPRAVRRESIIHFLRARDKEEGKRSQKTGKDKKELIRVNPIKDTKRKRQSKLQHVGFTNSTQRNLKKDGQW